MTFRRSAQAFALLSGMALSFAPLCAAQDASSPQSWSASSQQQDPNGAFNPIRWSETHSQADGRTIDKTSMETRGPDGRYVPYSDTEKETARVNDTTVRTIERTYGRGPDGQRVLIQQRQEDSHSLPDGEQKVVRTISNPDANGNLQVVQRELEDSKQLSPGVRETQTTVLMPNLNGGLVPSVQIENRETKNGDGTVASRKATMLSDGAGHWQLSEVRESTSKPESPQVRATEERVLHPDSNGNLALAERTVSRKTDIGSGQTRDTTETYSTNVPGQAGSEGLQLVQRETTVRRDNPTGKTTTRQVEQLNPGAPQDGLRLTQEAIDIVRPNGGGPTQQQQIVLTPGSNGRLDQVWIDVGRTSNPTAIPVDTRPTKKAP
jgi:hypothetical protein